MGIAEAVPGTDVEMLAVVPVMAAALAMVEEEAPVPDLDVLHHVR